MELLVEGVEDDLGHDLGRGILGLEADNPVPISFFELWVGLVVGVHAEGMVEGIQVVLDSLLHDLEITDHLVLVEIVSLKDELDFAGVTMRELALVRVLREHVAVFNVDGLADPEGHEGLGKGCGRGGTFAGSGAAGIPENLDVESVAVSIATILAEVDKTLVASAYRPSSDTLGHEKDFVWRDFPFDPIEQILDLFEIPGIGDDELQLEGVVVDPFTDRLGLEPALVVLLDPPLLDLSTVGRGVAEFRTQ